jgi:hypothetical protein
LKSVGQNEEMAANLQSLVGFICRQAGFDETPETSIIQVVDVRYTVSAAICPHVPREWDSRLDEIGQKHNIAGNRGKGKPERRTICLSP